MKLQDIKILFCNQQLFLHYHFLFPSCDITILKIYYNISDTLLCLAVLEIYTSTNADIMYPIQFKLH